MTSLCKLFCKISYNQDRDAWEPNDYHMRFFLMMLLYWKEPEFFYKFISQAYDHKKDQCNFTTKKDVYKFAQFELNQEPCKFSFSELDSESETVAWRLLSDPKLLLWLNLGLFKLY